MLIYIYGMKMSNTIMAQNIRKHQAFKLKPQLIIIPPPCGQIDILSLPNTNVLDAEIV